MRKLALGFFLLAAIFVGLWIAPLPSWVDALSPNAITECLGIALALTVIDRFVQQRDLDRIRPLVDYTLDTIDLGVSLVASHVVFDYHRRHLNPEQMPTPVLDCVQFWLDHQPTEDVTGRIATTMIGTAGVIEQTVRWPYPAGGVAEFAEATYRLTEENRHDLVAANMTAVVIASKQFATSVSLLAEVVVIEDGVDAIEIGRLSPEDESARREGRERETRRSAVEELQRFLQAYERGRAGRARLDVGALTFATAKRFRPPEASA